MYSVTEQSGATRRIVDVAAAVRKVRDLDGPEVLQASLVPFSNLVSSGGSGTGAIKDILYNTNTTAITNNGNHVRGTVQLTNHPHGPQPLTYTSLTPATATVNATTGDVTYVSAGPVQIQVTTPTQKWIASWTNFQQGGTTFLNQAGWAVGSLGAHIDAAMQALVAGKTAPTFGAPTNNGDGTTTVTASNTLTDVFNVVAGNGDYSTSTKNATGILSGINTSCLALRYFPHGPNMVAITPQHVVYAAHYDFPDNTPTSFVGASGTVYQRTRVGRLGPSVTFNGQTSNQDCEIGVLDTPLPADVTPVKFAPANWIGYMPSGTDTGTQYPIFCHVQEHRLTIHTMQQNNLSQTAGISWSAAPAKTGPYVGWAQTIRGGDSGSGVFLLVNGALNYLGHIEFPGPSGSAEAGFRAQIDTALAASGTAYRTSVADWSAFTYYG